MDGQTDNKQPNGDNVGLVHACSILAHVYAPVPVYIRNLRQSMTAKWCASRATMQSIVWSRTRSGKILAKCDS